MTKDFLQNFFTLDQCKAIPRDAHSLNNNSRNSILAMSRVDGKHLLVTSKPKITSSFTIRCQRFSSGNFPKSLDNLVLLLIHDKIVRYPIEKANRSIRLPLLQPPIFLISHIKYKQRSFSRIQLYQLFC